MYMELIMKKVNSLLTFEVKVIIIIVIIALAALLSMRFGNRSDIYYVEVKYDGKVVDYFELTEELDTIIEYNFKGYNKVQFKDGYVDVLEADCPDKIDVLMAPINKDSWNKTIICAPNKLVIQIVGGERTIDGLV